MRGAGRLIAMLTVGALIAAGCGGDDDEATGGGEEESDVLTDFGVTDDTIRVGLLADLSGPFAVTVADIAVAQQAYFDRVNAEGGIAGREVELVIEDTKYDVPTHQQLFQQFAAEDESGVVFVSQSTGSPQTANIAPALVDSHLIALALTFYSGWPDPEFGQNVFETYTNYCLESMNALQFMADEGAESIAIVSFPGEYGQDGATGAKLAAEELGLEVVYDGEGAIIPPTPTNPNPDNSAVVRGIVDNDPDWVWVTSTPGVMAQIIGQAAAGGYDGKWSGNGPSYVDDLLNSDIAEIIDSSYWVSAYTVPFGADVEGMDEMVQAISESSPDAVASDFYVYGWTEAQITDAVLRRAAENGDLTREGVEAAAFEIEVDFQGLAPPQTWAGDPNEFIVRESYIHKPTADLYSSESLTDGGNTGNEQVRGPFASEQAANYDYQGPCFAPQG